MTTLYRIPRHYGFALLSYCLLTLIFTFPLITQMNTHVLGEARLDNYEYVWKMGWVAQAIQRGESPFFAPEIYVPQGYSLAYGEITPIHTFAMLPLTLIFGPITTYNLAALFSTILSGLGVYVLSIRWLRRLDVSQDRVVLIAAFFAGAAFAFSAYRMQKLTGHLPLFDTQWLMLALLFLDSWLETRRYRDAAFTGLFIAFAALSSWYYAFMLGLLLPVFVLFYTGRTLWSLLNTPRTWISLLIVILIVGGLCVPFLVPYLQLDTEGATVVPVSDAAFWAASFTDYLMPNPLHPLWGDTVERVMWPFPTPMMTEFVISIGWITLIFALPALRGTQGRNWRGLKGLTTSAFILSLGPILYISRLPLGIPLPDQLLREILPFADSIRSWGRFSVFVMLGMSILASAGIVLLLKERTPRTRTVVSVGALVLMLFGAWIGLFPTTPVTPRTVDTWLANQPGDSPIMEYPLGEALSGPAMYYTSVHQRPVVFGYGTYLPLLYRQRHPAVTAFPDDAALDQLSAWGVEYILISQWALSYDHSFTRQDVDAQQRLEHVITVDDVAVYRLNE
jgi:hypothetical protein